MPDDEIVRRLDRLITAVEAQNQVAKTAVERQQDLSKAVREGFGALVKELHEGFTLVQHTIIDELRRR